MDGGNSGNPLDKHLKRWYNIINHLERRITMTKEDLEQIRALMREEIKPINDRLDKMDIRLDKIEDRLDNVEDQIAEIKQDTEITRAATNEIIKWIEVNADEKTNPFPIKKVAL